MRDRPMSADNSLDTATRHDQHGQWPQAETVDDFRHNLATRFPAKRAEAILALCQDGKQLAATPVHAFMDLLVI